MTRSLIIMPAAQFEIIEAQGWYEKEATGLGGYFGPKLTDKPSGLLPTRCNFR